MGLYLLRVSLLQNWTDCKNTHLILLKAKIVMAKSSLSPLNSLDLPTASSLTVDANDVKPC